MQVVVHGGAGSPPDTPDTRAAALEATARGHEEATPLSGVCAAVNALEADPQFNAGVGGAVQSDGTAGEAHSSPATGTARRG